MSSALFIDPFASKENLKNFLLKLKEDKELDELLIIYIRNILNHKIIMVPSKGPYGEQGKDIVALEDQSTGHYCSYVIKRGTLNDNLYGKYGILKQMEDALFIELEIEEYRGKRRTVVVAHNGDEGYRGALQVFENEKRRLNNEINDDLLLRPIDRWDIEEITNRFFPHGEKFKEFEDYNIELDKMRSSMELVKPISNLYNKMKVLSESDKNEDNSFQMLDMLKEFFNEVIEKTKDSQLNDDLNIGK